MKKYWVAIPTGLFAVVGIGLAALTLKEPAKRPAPTLQIEATPQRIARGKYLYEQVAHCAGCHNERGWDRFSAPTLPGRVGAGFEFPAAMGLPGRVVAPNISSDNKTGLGLWTDGEILRALREGVSRDGRALFPFMPYTAYRQMSDEDAYSLVAFLRTLPPVPKQMSLTQLNFPVNLLIKFTPQPLETKVNTPNRADTRAYGKYLVGIGGCIECHSPMDKGKVIEGKEFSGGQEFAIGGFVVRSANITPDEETGIGKWTEERFVTKFRGYASMNFANAPKHNQSNFTLMPWVELSTMPDEDLRAIYAHLRSLKPVYNSVEVHPPAQAALAQAN